MVEGIEGENKPSMQGGEDAVVTLLSPVGEGEGDTQLSWAQEKVYI